jgi:glycosyltransferase involved in cell wall biosynthesis
MRIAQVSPLFESVPPAAYGGTERVVAYLTDALVEAGHDVTLIASGDSSTRARLISAAPRALRLDGSCQDSLAHHILELELVAQLADRFDIIHFHTGFLHLPIARRLTTPSVTTLHGRLDLRDLFPLMAAFRDAPMVSISNAQRRPIPDATWSGTVYHGLPPRLLPFSPTPGDYVVFLGRISPEKRADRAIEIARRAGVELLIAEKVDNDDRDYFAQTIEPLLAGPGVRYIGEVSESEKASLLGGARALLFPIDWPEPFGMVVIEALSCGTPVIAWNHGSVPELLQPGVDGWIVESVDEAVEALRRIDRIDRRACRATFERRFTVDRMARDYLAIYETLMRNPGAQCLEAVSA